MYSYKEWSKDNKNFRFYINPASCPSFVYVTTKGKVGVVSDDEQLAKSVYDQLQTHLNIEGRQFTLDELRSELKRLTSMSGSKKSYPKKQTMLASASVRVPSTGGAAQNSLNHFANTIKMDAKTLKNVEGFIDTREAQSTVSHYVTGAVPCQLQMLDIGDIQFRNDTEKTLIVIERKTVADFYQSITSTRAHSQAERLYAHAAAMREQGWRVMVCWLVIESDTQSIYDVLPETKQMDGMINYLSAILGQHVFRVFNDQHGAYLVNKLVQGFNELKLTYSVKNESGQRVDIPKKSMKIAAVPAEERDAASHNVNMAKTNQLLYTLTSFSSINMKTAKALQSTGKSLREILSMTESELIAVDGIGKKLAKNITAEFSI